jgi:hypothetical protein
VYALSGLARAGCSATKIRPDYTKGGCAAYSAAIRAMYEDMGQGAPERDSSTKFKNFKGGGHNPFVEDDSLRGQCNGVTNCNTYSLLLGFATKPLDMWPYRC